MLRLRSKALHYRKIVDLSFMICLISTVIYISKPDMVVRLICCGFQVFFSISTIGHYAPYLYYKMLYYEELRKEGLIK